MTGPVLKVDPKVLEDAGTTFGQAGDGLAGLVPDVPLGSAAAGVQRLESAAACHVAQAAVSAEMTAVANAARQYGSSLGTAAVQYVARDQAAASAVEGVQI